MTDVVKTYRARRPQKIGTETRQPGELVPEAATWFRVDSSVHTGFLTEVYVSPEEFREAVQKYCPDLTRELEYLSGISLEIIPAAKAPAKKAPVIIANKS